MSSASEEAAAAPRSLPMDQQRLFGELTQMHKSHARIEAQLEALLDCQKGLDVSMNGLRRRVLGLAKISFCDDVVAESNVVVPPALSERNDKAKLSVRLPSEKTPSEEDTACESGSTLFVASTLPLGWPRCLKLRSEVNHMAVTKTSDANISVTNSIACSRSLKDRFFDSTEDAEIESASHRCVIDPNSKFHIAWSTSGILILTWDLFSLPFLLAWDIELSGFLHVVSLLTPGFWTIDIILNLFTGFYSGGGLNMNLNAIRRAYLQSWLVLDLIIVLCDWIVVVIFELFKDGIKGGSSFRIVRILKLGRTLRMLGIMRVLIFVRKLAKISKKHEADGTRLALQLSKLLMGILWVVHVVACIWFSLGKYGPSDTGARWTDSFDVIVDGRTVPVIEAGNTYQYMVSLNWAAGQIALGAFDVEPLNSMERGFFICVMMCAFLFGSTLVSSLSAAMIDYQMMKKDKTLRLRTLRRYLRENEVDVRLSIPVTKQVEQRITHREPLDEKDVTALDLLSSTLRSHLRYEIQRPYLSRHPIFRLWESLDSAIMHRICMKAVSFVHMRPKDELFVPSVIAGAAHTLICGRMLYTQYPDSSPVQSDQTERVDAGKWICEAALWIQWTHVGSCEAVTHCKLLEVNAEQLMVGLHFNLLIRDIAIEYGGQFHKRVTSAGPPHSLHPTDLHVPFTDYCDLVASMSPQIQLVIGRAALRHISGPGRGFKAIERLRSEVESSKSVIVVEGSGAIIRVVSLVVLRVTDEKGNVLTQVGKWSGSDMQSLCELPGLKQERGESLGDTSKRIIKRQLPVLQGKLEYACITRDDSDMMSKDLCVQTRCLSAVFSAAMKHGEVLDGVICQSRNDRRNSMWSSLRSTCIEPNEGSLKFDASQNQAVDDLRAIDVYIIREASGDPNLYAWLSPEKSSMLRTSIGERALQKWISGLTFDDQSRLDKTESRDEFWI